MARSYRGPRIDCDIHHAWRNDEQLVEYLPARWREFARLPVRGLAQFNAPSAFNTPSQHGRHTRLETLPASGEPPGSSYDLLRDQLLDPFNIRRAIVSFDIGQHAGVYNREFAIELVRAANRWSIEHWLSGQDRRIYGSLLVQTHEPDVAADDIRALGGHPRIAEVLLVTNSLGKPFGHPVYHPIFAAAQEMDLPVAFHVAGENFSQGAFSAAGGEPPSKLDSHVCHMQGLQHYWVSLVCDGVFLRFPRLRVVLKETGLAGWPWLLWELDACVDILRSEGRALPQLPSDYFRDHAVLTTQPLDESPQDSQLIALLEAFGGLERHLCFASDYPHYDADDPLTVSRRLPPAWWDAIFYENALRIYGWSKAELGIAGEQDVAPLGR